MESKTKKYLKALAHNLNPTVFIGVNKLNETVLKAVNENLNSNELIKIKFIKHKEEKKELLNSLAFQTNAFVVALIGNIGILFKQNKDKKKQKINIKI